MSNHILIYGYGREGQSTHDFLQQHHLAEQITIYDARTHLIDWDWDSYDQIWLSPGIPPEQIPVSERHKLTSQANYFFSNLTDDERRKVIAITGSKGKTTTTMAMAHCLQQLGLRAETAGNIGIPLLEALPKLQHGQLDYLVVEVSSFQAQFIRRSPHTAVFLNFFPDHIDRHGDEYAYFWAKANLWWHQQPGDHLVAPKVTAGRFQKPPKNLTAAPKLGPRTYKLESILDATHFRENLGVIPVVLKKLKIKYDTKVLAEALRTTPLPDHRLQLVGEAQGLKFYDDAIAVNPSATIAAVTHLQKEIGGLILGGKSSGDDPTALVRFLEENVPHIFVFVTSSELADELKQIETSLHIVEVKNLEAVMDLVHNSSFDDKHSTILLSPAAKSYDQYANFQEKGDHFQTLVRSLES